jgi:hypothetical protein
MDDADRAQIVIEGSQPRTFSTPRMAAGTDLRAGQVADTQTCCDGKWHQKFPNTVSPKGHTLVQQPKVQQGITNAGHVQDL